MKRFKAFVDNILENIFGIPISKSKKIEELTLDDLQKFYCFVFIRFLKDKKVYNKFIIAVRQREEGHKSLYGNFAVNDAFTWRNTKEGHRFWDRINSEWESYLGKLYRFLLDRNVDILILRQLTNYTNPYLDNFINNRKLGT